MLAKYAIIVRRAGALTAIAARSGYRGRVSADDFLPELLVAETPEVADRIVVFRRGENAGERKPGETSADEIVRLMVGK